MFEVDSSTGEIRHPKIIRSLKPNIEHGPLLHIQGIIVHQTNSPSAQSTLGGYTAKSKDLAGAHFLIDKDGSIYQTASLFKRTTTLEN